MTTPSLADGAGMDEMYYFGCIGRAGHFLHDGNGRTIYDNSLHPWGDGIDGDLLPKGDQTEGKAIVTHKDGWTALSFWDRSVDGRGNSHSDFLIKGTYGVNEMLALSRERFPAIYKRFKFDVSPHTAMGEVMG